MHVAWRLCVAVLVAGVAFWPSDAFAQRRGVRVDLNAWTPASAIPVDTGVPQPPASACPGAGVSRLPGTTLRYGWVNWNGNYYFQTALLDGLGGFVCQRGKPYQAGLGPGDYFNQVSLVPDERGLASMVGPNTNNAVTAIRYSFVDSFPDVSFGRQWTFYFFPGGLVVVGLYGVPDDFSYSPYESILDLQSFYSVFNAERDYFYGQYFCFQGGSYIGDCVPVPDETILFDGFE